jgi:hypothetical protein
MGLRTSGSNFLIIGIFLCSTTFCFLVQNSPRVKTCLQKPWFSFAPFEDWPWPFSHKCHFSSSSYMTIGISSLASLWGCPFVAQVISTISDLPITIWKGVAHVAQVFQICCKKTWPTPNGPPNPIDYYHIIP